MADNNKAVGPLAAAKLVALIKAITAKKYDKAGGKIEGSAEITGGLKVGSSSEFSSSIKAGSEISSDMLLMAPIVALYDPATDEGISFGVSGENAAKVTSPVSGGGTQYARLAVGTPTGDNDAATKAYVDAKVDTTVYVDFWPTSTEDVYDKDLKAYVVELATSQTFDAIFDFIKAGEKIVARFYDDEAKSKLLASSVGANISGDKTLGTINFQFVSAGVTDVAGFPFIGEIITMIKVSSGVTSYLFVGNTVLPAPNGDGTDNGKVPTINGTKWELKTPSAGGSPDAVLYTAQTLTDAQKRQARKNIGAPASELPTISGPVALCPSKVTDSNDAAHITTTRTNGDDFTITLDGGPENQPLRVKGIRTPTDADTDAAANVEYVKAKIAEVAASGGVDVDNALSATSTNPVQNKAVKAAIDGKADKTDLNAKMDKSGGTFTGNVHGKYFCGTWLQSTEASDLGRTPGKIAVMDDSGWVYYRTPAELFADLGIANAIKSYVDAAITAAINSSY